METIIYIWWTILLKIKAVLIQATTSVNPKDILCDLNGSRTDTACWPFCEVPREEILRDREKTGC